MIDIAIIGAGPAGLSAAVNAATRNKNAVIFGRRKDTSWLYRAEKVNNHLGMPDMSGEEMMEAFYEHAKRLDIEIKDGRVLQILSMGDYFTINFENEFFNAKIIVLATGISKGKGVEGENEFLGKGVSYCATCDGMLYRGKQVVVVAEIEEGEEDANFLSEICEKVYFIPGYKGKYALNDNIDVVDGKVTQVFGNDFVEGIRVEDKEILCEGAFFIKEATPLSSLIAGLEMDGNSIKVNRNMETNLKGVYAAGDCTGWPFQVSNAIGDGLVAAQHAVKSLK